MFWGGQKSWRLKVHAFTGWRRGPCSRGQCLSGCCFHHVATRGRRSASPHQDMKRENSALASLLFLQPCMDFSQWCCWFIVPRVSTGHRPLGEKGQQGCHTAFQRSVSTSVKPLSHQRETTVAALSQHRDIITIHLDALPLQRRLGGVLMHA